MCVCLVTIIKICNHHRQNVLPSVCFQVRLKPSGPQLFDGSEDEEEDGDEEEEDGSRFDIRPEFEGPAGQKVRSVEMGFLNCFFFFICIYGEVSAHRKRKVFCRNEIF